MNLADQDVIDICEEIWNHADRRSRSRPDQRMDAWCQAFDKLLVIRSLIYRAHADGDLILLIDWLVESSIPMATWRQAA